MPYLRLLLPKNIEDDLKLVLDYSHSIAPSERAYLNKYLMKFEDLPARSIKDSFLEGRLQFSSDKTLRRIYQTSTGNLRIARLLEDMDMFAIFVAKTYVRYPSVPKDVASPFAVVTFHVDQIDFTDFKPKMDVDILLSGHVTWVGKSTMEVIIWCEQEINGQSYKICSGLFLLAVRDATCIEAAPANPLIPLNDYEKEILRNGVLRKDKRKKRFLEHITKMSPSPEEIQEIHDIYSKSTDDNNANFEGMEAIKNCALSNVIVTHLEDINALTAVFGGFIMGHAFDLAWLLAWKFSGQNPILKRIGDITFFAPALKYVLRLDAQVIYTNANYYQIYVVVYIIDQGEGKDTKTSSFHFTFKANEEVKKVYPLSYQEAMLYIDGKRHFDSFLSNEEGSNGRDLNNDYFKKNHRVSKL